MKSNPLEFAAIGAALLSIVSLSGWLAAFAAPFSWLLLADYHVFADFTLFLFFFIFLSAMTVRILLMAAPLKPETFAMLSVRAFYWKFITSVTEIGGMYFLPFVPLFLRPQFFSLFGAKIGKNVEVAGKLIELPLITLEDYAFVGAQAVITAHAITHDRIVLKPVLLRQRATLGVGVIVMPGVEVGENSVVAPGSVVTMGTVIGPNELWGGVPANKIRGLVQGD